MENITSVMKAAGWNRVVKVNVLLIRSEDFIDMNRIYAAHFPTEKYPARTTTTVSSFPQPEFLLEIDRVAVLE